MSLKKLFLVIINMILGWIKLHRSLRDWQWYGDHNATRLLIHLLLSVNFEDKKWKGVEIKAGSMILSWGTLSDESGLTVSQCRTSMKKLEISGEVTKQVTNKYQVITLMKWYNLQIDDEVVDKPPDRQLADKSQASRRRVTTTKEYKEVEEYKNLEPSKKELFDEWLEYRREIKKSINNVKTIKKLVTDFYNHTENEIRTAIDKSVKGQYQGLFIKKEKSFGKKDKKINRQDEETIRQNAEGWVAPE